jgi:hypothetical protein
MCRVVNRTTNTQDAEDNFETCSLLPQQPPPPQLPEYEKITCKSIRGRDDVDQRSKVQGMSESLIVASSTPNHSHRCPQWQSRDRSLMLPAELQATTVEIETTL